MYPPVKVTRGKLLGTKMTKSGLYNKQISVSLNCICSWYLHKCLDKSSANVMKFGHNYAILFF